MNSLRPSSWVRCSVRAVLALVFSVMALAGCSSGGGGSDPEVSTPAGYKPQGFVAIAYDASVETYWPRVAGATSYNLYWSTTAGVSVQTANKITAADAYYSHEGLSNGTTYYYAYTVVTASGESELSPEVALTPSAFNAARPNPFAANIGDSQVEVRWDGVANATSYNVYWKSSSGVTTGDTKIADATTPTVQTGLTNGQAYYFVVTAQTTAGESVTSPEIAAVPFLSEPLRPAAVSITAGGNQATLTWDAASGATSYDIYWSTAAGVSTASNKISTTSTTYAHTGLTNGTRYYYAVVANNASGASGLSREVSATPAAAVSGVPGGVTARTGNRENTLSWSAVSNATSYTIRWYTSGGATQTITDVAASPYVHTGRSAGTTIFYSVSAVVTGVTGTASTEVGATPNDVAPIDPLRLVARAGRGQISLEADYPSDVLRYNIFWSTSSNVSTADSKISNVRLPYTHTGLTDGTTYYYRVQVLNADGQSALSPTIGAAPNSTALSSVTVSDPNLQACIDTLAGENGWTYVHQVYYVNCNGQPGLDLAGINQYVNINYMLIENNTSLTGLGALDALNNLSELGVAGSGVATLDFLAGHFNLYAFRATGDAITDLSPLSGLVAMNSLYLGDNNFTDLSPLASLDQLRELWVGHDGAAGQITDLSPLAGLTSLESLHVQNNRVADLTPLAGLTQLQQLWVEHDSADATVITDLSPLQNLTALTDLRLDHNGITSLAPLAGLTRLDTLHLYDNSVAVLTPLAAMTDLLDLDLNSNLIAQSQLELLGGLTNLTRLILTGNSITSLAPLTTLTALTQLYAPNNQIVDASPAAVLTNLVQLDLSNNQLGDSATGKVDTLVTLTNATRIYLSGNVGMSCANVQTLLSALGSVVDLDGNVSNNLVMPDVATNGVNCTN